MEEMESGLQKLAAFNNEIKNTTDRSCVIVAAAFIDDMLEMLLKSFLTESSKTDNSDLFENNGALSTFSSKIKLSYRLGLISPYEYKQIERVRKIRNLFAHQVLVNSLDDDKVRGIVCEMKPKRKLLPPKEIPLLRTDKGIDIIPFIGLDEESIELEISKYAGEVTNERLPQIPDIDVKSCRDIFEKTIASIIDCLSARICAAVMEQRRPLNNYDSILDIAKARINKFSYKKFIELLEDLQKLKAEIKSQIIKIKQGINKSQGDVAMTKEFEKLLDETLTQEAKIDQEIQEMNKQFMIFVLQKFAVNQIEKALKKKD